jgi:hypothetical protein
MSRFFALILAFASLATAQEFRSTLTGRVTDPTGAVVPSAKIQAIETATNSRFETVTNSDGLYTFPLLLPGTYQLAAEARGFKKAVQTGIQIGTNTRVAQDVTLRIGESSESVTITSDAPPLETVKASAGQVITTHELENLPLNGHTALDVEFYGFGVISQGNRDSNGPSSNGGLGSLSMGGAPSGANEMLLDGVPNVGTQGTTGRRPAFLPPPDSVSEVKTEAFNMDAAAGGAGGGTTEMVTKGGTNTLHGALSEYNNDSALQATPFFTNASPTSGGKPLSETNQWAATVGGPIWIPKVINGKNRLFFFFAYEGEKSGGPTQAYGTVPTAAERQGDFSQLLSLNNKTKNYTLYDPNTAVLSGGVITRQPFTNNIIPTSRLNPIAQNFLSSYVPLPNIAGVYDDTNNYSTNENVKNPYHFFSGRADVNISDRDKLTIVGRQSLYLQYDNDIFHNLAYLNHGLGRDLWGGFVDYIHTFTPTLIGDLRVGFNRYDAFYFQASTGSWPDLTVPKGGFNPTALGFPSYLASNANVLQMPTFTASDGYTLNGNNSGHYTNQPYNTYQLFNSYTWVRGQHTIKFGGEVRLQDFTNINWANSTGTFTFDTGTWVKQTSNATAPTLGGSMAQFLLGLPTSGSYPINAQSKADAYYDALFVQDDWRLKPNLTLNLGLRWEKDTPTTESHDRQSIGFDPTATNQVTAPAEAAYAKSPLPQLPVSAFLPTGGLLFATSSNRDPYSTSNKAFAPRLGVAWSPAALHNKTVIRSGIGIFYFNYGTVTPNQQGFSQSTTYVASNNSNLTPATTLSNPFPTGIVQPVGSAQGLNTYLGQSVTVFNPHYANEYSLRWDFDVQQQLSPNTTLEVGYIGNHGVHLPTNYNFGSLPAQYLSTLPYRDTATINALGAIVPNPFAGLLPGQSLNGTTTSVSNLLKAFPEFSGVTVNALNNGDSYFSQLAIKLQKRLNNGLQFFVNFSHSRLMDHTNYLNAGSWVLEKRVAADDRPNYLVFSALYDLPVGRGKHFLANAHRAVLFVVGGWQVAGEYTYYPGAPLAWGNVIYNGAPLNYNASDTNGSSFNTAAFNTVSSQQLASNYRTFPSQFNNLRIDSANNVNVNMTKTFTIHENLKLQFRAESFNVANHPLFESPNLTPTSSTFGYITATTNSPRAIQIALRLTF